jgi:uncharacterized membrane protein
MRFSISDLFIIIGSILFGIGLYMIYPPLFYLFSGGMLIFFGYLGAVKEVRTNGDAE